MNELCFFQLAAAAEHIHLMQRIYLRDRRESSFWEVERESEKQMRPPGAAVCLEPYATAYSFVCVRTLAGASFRKLRFTTPLVMMLMPRLPFRRPLRKNAGLQI